MLMADRSMLRFDNMSKMTYMGEEQLEARDLREVRHAHHGLLDLVDVLHVDVRVKFSR